jgi:AcrR family transcriptional regulator
MPRAGLTQTRVLEEAERLADEVGLSQLTLAALAARLGVRQPSLYKHIDGMDGLQRGLAVRAKNELANILARAAIGRERGDAITAIGHAYREWAHEHPGRYAAAQPAPAPDDAEAIAASQAVVSVTTAVLAGYRLRDDDAIDATRALRSALHGFVTLELAGGFGLPVDIDRSYERLVSGLVTALSSWTDEQATTSSHDG